jgi:hypothetical protein
MQIKHKTKHNTGKNKLVTLTPPNTGGETQSSERVSSPYNQKNTTLSELFQKSHRKIVEIGKIDTPNTQIHASSLSSRGTSIFTLTSIFRCISCVYVFTLTSIFRCIFCVYVFTLTSIFLCLRLSNHHNFKSFSYIFVFVIFFSLLYFSTTFVIDV